MFVRSPDKGFPGLIDHIEPPISINRNSHDHERENQPNGAACVPVTGGSRGPSLAANGLCQRKDRNKKRETENFDQTHGNQRGSWVNCPSQQRLKSGAWQWVVRGLFSSAWPSQNSCCAAVANTKAVSVAHM